MKAFVLILCFWGQSTHGTAGGPACISQEFSSETNCDNARVGMSFNLSAGGYKHISAKCYQK